MAFACSQPNWEPSWKLHESFQVPKKEGIMSARPKKTQKTSAKNIPAATFDDAVALLLQLEPGDMDGFQRLSDTLEAVASAKGTDSSVAKLVRSAKEQMDKLIQGETNDTEEVLIEASRLLDAASNAQESALQNSDESRTEAQAAAPTASAAQNDAPKAAARIDVAPVVQVESRAAAPAASHPAAEANLPVEEISAVESLPADADPDLLTEFVMESRELLESSETALLALENNSADFESVNTVFRAFHTVKGTSGFLGLRSASEMAHLAESLLSRIRNKEIRLVGGYADLALRSLDMLKKIVNSVESALRGAPLEKPAGYEDLKIVLADPEGAGISEQIPDEEAIAPTEQDQALTEPVNETLEIKKDALSEESSSINVNPPDAPVVAKKQAVAQRDGEFESSIRVNTARLDRLIDMVGELVIAQSMVAQDRRLFEEHCHELLRKVTHAGKIVRELQDLSMSMRMVPLRGTFQKMQRVARDLARKSGKSVELVTDDGETEIDRHMVDILNDVLVHMVRNSIDHGIEPQDDREKCGKNRTGTVRLMAFHSGGSVVVEIHDDGRGLNREKILQKAISVGLVDPEKQLSDNEVFNLIFAPGLSTSEKLTDISGRGVGMDVVRKGVEALHGRIDINTAPGVGCIFTVRLPLTLAITDGMLVRVGRERYIIPTISIHLCFRPKPESLSTVTGRGELVMLRGELMPIFRLHRLFDIDAAIEDPVQGLLVVVGDEERRCALLVDELLGQQQVVAKSLTKAVGKIPGVSGGAILGDGQVGLILDPGEVAAQARQTPGLYLSGLSAA
jgi:two-component system, chemotaxis family, sensor kinase CheA